MSRQIFLWDRLLDPGEIIGRKPLNPPLGLGRIERLVEIEHQRDVGTEQLAQALDPALVIRCVAVAAFDLDALESLVEGAPQRLLVGVGFDRAIAVIAADWPRRSA